LLPRPHHKDGIPLWVGGRSKAALLRAGHLADGWLTANSTPQEVGDGIEAIRAYAAELARQVPDDHYGVLLPFFFAKTMDEAVKIGGPSIRKRPEVSFTEYSALGTPEQVCKKIQQYVSAGATKFVMRPSGPKDRWRDQIETLAKEVIPRLQTPFSPAERQERLG
jgi:alkanesulfonate monooxygenase SsuD/methylene tetrahydromethanopterin reductase-like flavin-dependent oxidoreductase (luciferase family)